MRVLLGPTNFAGQPMTLARALRARGLDAHHVLYAWNGRVPYGYDHDDVRVLNRGDWLRVQMATLREKLEQGYSVYHLWHRTLVYPPGPLSFFSGLDLPYIKASGAAAVCRFTGYELRRRSLDMELNPYSPFHSGYDSGYDESVQLAYLDHLREWTDRFIVQDPEMQTFLPEAEIVPRGIDLNEFSYVGAKRRERPVVLHAPSRQQLKGTEQVVATVERLRQRGLSFEFHLVEGVDHREATKLYAEADIVIDQMLIGWYGVLAMEAMALGKPVLAYVRPDLFERFSPPIPIVNATIDDLDEKLGDLIADPERREELGLAGRAFAEAVHDINHVASSIERIYTEVSAQQQPALKARSPRYLELTAKEPLQSAQKALQFDRISDELPLLRQQARLYGALKERVRGRDAAPPPTSAEQEMRRRRWRLWRP
jgi:glycosyltransferase involved in cell wall biosynthesis